MKILVIDDHPLIQEALKHVSDRARCVARAHSGARRVFRARGAFTNVRHRSPGARSGASRLRRLRSARGLAPRLARHSGAGAVGDIRQGHRRNGARPGRHGFHSQDCQRPHPGRCLASGSVRRRFRAGRMFRQRRRSFRPANRDQVTGSRPDTCDRATCSSCWSRASRTSSSAAT